MIQQSICIFMLRTICRKSRRYEATVTLHLAVRTHSLLRTAAVALRLAFYALSVGRREGSKQQSYYMLLCVHCLRRE
jgi:hypothetical protein